MEHYQFAIVGLIITLVVAYFINRKINGKKEQPQPTNEKKGAIWRVEGNLRESVVFMEENEGIVKTAVDANHAKNHSMVNIAEGMDKFNNGVKANERIVRNVTLGQINVTENLVGICEAMLKSGDALEKTLVKVKKSRRWF